MAQAPWQLAVQGDCDCECHVCASGQAREALKHIADHKATAHLLKRCSVSSDSFGSLPVFKEGKLIEYKARLALEPSHTTSTDAASCPTCSLYHPCWHPSL